MTEPHEQADGPLEKSTGPRSEESSKTMPPTELGKENPQSPTAARPEKKLFNLFAQALFSAPLARESASHSPTEADAADRVPFVAPKLRALIVGFTEQERSVLCTLFCSLHFDTVTATDANQAINILTGQSVALVAIDWDSAAAHALVLVRAITKLPIEQPFVIVVATQPPETVTISAADRGVVKFFEKPLSQDGLVEWLRGQGLALPELFPAS